MGKLYNIAAILSFLLIFNYSNIKDLSTYFITYFFSYVNYIHNNNESLIKKFTEINYKKGKFNILVIGDSHLKKFNFLSNKSIYNISINGETTEGVLKRFDCNIKNLQYDKVIIQIGYNDFKITTTNTLKSNYLKLINKLKCENIIIISLYPVDYKRYYINSKIIDINNFLYNYCKENFKCHFLNIHNLLLNSSKTGINSKFTTDGVHLNDQGNEIVANALLKHL